MSKKLRITDWNDEPNVDWQELSGDEEDDDLSEFKVLPQKEEKRILSTTSTTTPVPSAESFARKQVSNLPRDLKILLPKMARIPVTSFESIAQFHGGSGMTCPLLTDSGRNCKKSMSYRDITGRKDCRKYCLYDKCPSWVNAIFENPLHLIYNRNFYTIESISIKVNEETDTDRIVVFQTVWIMDTMSWSTPNPGADFCNAISRYPFVSIQTEIVARLRDTKDKKFRPELIFDTKDGIYFLSNKSWDVLPMSNTRITVVRTDSVRQ